MQESEWKMSYDKPCKVHQGPYSAVLSSNSPEDGGRPTGLLTSPNNPDRAVLLRDRGELQRGRTMTKCGRMALDSSEAKIGR